MGLLPLENPLLRKIGRRDLLLTLRLKPAERREEGAVFKIAAYRNSAHSMKCMLRASL